MDVGHALLGEHGEILNIDKGFCAILQTDERSMIGRSILDVTVSDDRTICRDLMRDLQATQAPFQVKKRFLRPDGTAVWVSNTVSIVRFGDAPGMIVSTIVPIDPPADHEAPGMMLEAARFMLAARADRRAVFDTAAFSEPGWDMVLAAYVIEAEGGTIALATLATMAQTPPIIARRWALALVQEGLFEPEGTRAAYRLTGAAHAKCETYLSGVLARSQPRLEPVEPV